MNIRKQIVKAPKLHFFDTGLVCHLLGIKEPSQLRLHPLRGAVFESWVVSELYKAMTHKGEIPALHHYRENRGLEIDVLIQNGNRFHAVEIKSGATASTDFFKGLTLFAERIKGAGEFLSIDNVVVYGGETTQKRSTARLLSWRDVGTVLDG